MMAKLAAGTASICWAGSIGSWDSFGHFGMVTLSAGTV